MSRRFLGGGQRRYGHPGDGCGTVGSRMALGGGGGRRAVARMVAGPCPDATPPAIVRSPGSQHRCHLPSALGSPAQRGRHAARATAGSPGGKARSHAWSGTSDFRSARYLDRQTPLLRGRVRSPLWWHPRAGPCLPDRSSRPLTRGSGRFRAPSAKLPVAWIRRGRCTSSSLFRRFEMWACATLVSGSNDMSQPFPGGWCGSPHAQDSAGRTPIAGTRGGRGPAGGPSAPPPDGADPLRGPGIAGFPSPAPADGG